MQFDVNHYQSIASSFFIAHRESCGGSKLEIMPPQFMVFYHLYRFAWVTPKSDSHSRSVMQLIHLVLGRPTGLFHLV